MKNNKSKNKIIFTKKQEQEIIDMYVNQNISKTGIAKAFNCDMNRITNLLKKNNIPEKVVENML